MNAGQTEIRSAYQDLCWQLFHPLLELNQCIAVCSPSKGDQWRIRLFDQISGPLPLMGLKGMQNGWGRLVMLGIPTAGTSMQKRHQITICPLQLGMQGLGKQGMIAIPPLLVIQ